MKWHRPFDYMSQRFPVIHLFGDWYLMRNYSRKARKFSLWGLVNKKDFPKY